ncbi:hypothetical protein KFL_000070570 [Klebsormidium nitens]|uniref:Tyr recombinase domain-containing protein n=1 Tax=Klebsormidium nitens TaxID=105231 RepID=A0A1Y1HLP7_KLENI|nr:hypothetical protein KFL_000070570 [Klebsormidium nitens]|eukprot:GAQ78089.1 hypothetical protein KFL_000070570 [Klebsormidium nitens]
MKFSAIVICYTTFYRYDDLMALTWQNVKILPTHAELFIPDSKTDQYLRGDTTFIARLGGRYCPVALLERLLKVGQYPARGPGSLIRSTIVCPPTQRLKSNTPCYDTVLSWFKGAASLLGLDPSLYGTHSGRRGGATGAAAHNVPDRLFKRHGRWRSDRAKDLYVRETLQARLATTRNLGLQEDIPIAQLRAFESEACFFYIVACSSSALHPGVPAYQQFPASSVPGVTAPSSLPPARRFIRRAPVPAIRRSGGLAACRRWRLGGVLKTATERCFVVGGPGVAPVSFSLV